MATDKDMKIKAGKVVPKTTLKEQGVTEGTDPLPKPKKPPAIRDANVGQMKRDAAARRERIATAALQGMLSNSRLRYDSPALVTLAVQQADLLIASLDES